MFGFSFQKLLLLAAVIAAVWYGFKLVSRLQKDRELEARRDGGKPRSGATTGSSRRAKDEPETMVQCPVCGTYVAGRSARNCGRGDCPY